MNSAKGLNWLDERSTTWVNSAKGLNWLDERSTKIDWTKDLLLETNNIIFHFTGTCEVVLQSLSGTKWYIKNLGIFPLFCDFSRQSFWSVKLTAIPGRTANTIPCSPQTCCLSVVNKKNFSGFNDKIFTKFWAYIPKRIKLWKNFGKFFADVRGKI